MKKSVAFILLVALALIGCKKEPLPELPEETGPYYSIQGYIDGEYIDLNVGQEGIKISQGVEYDNGVRSYFGQILSPIDDILIKIQFVRPERPMTSKGLDAFDLSNLGFLVHEPGCISLDYGGSLVQPNYVLIKDEQGDFQAVNDVSFSEYGIHDMTIKFTDLGSNSFQVPVNYGFNDVQLNSKFQSIEYGDSVIFNPNNSSGTHEWYVDNYLVSGNTVCTTSVSNGVHLVEHRFKDENNNESIHSTLIRFTDSVFDWQMGLTPCSSTNNSNYGKVTVTAVVDGETYKSHKAIDNLDKSFAVSNIEYVGNYSAAPSRVVFDFYFESTLLNGNQTDSLSLTAMSGTFNAGL
jgi:hypothetical protein